MFRSFAICLWLATLLGQATAATGGCPVIGSPSASSAPPSSSSSTPAVAAAASPSASTIATSGPASSASASGALPSPGLTFDKDWSQPLKAACDISYLVQMRVASPHDFIPSRGPFSLLVFKAFAEKDATDSNRRRQSGEGAGAFFMALEFKDFFF